MCDRGHENSDNNDVQPPELRERGAVSIVWLVKKEEFVSSVLIFGAILMINSIIIHAVISFSPMSHL